MVRSLFLLTAGIIILTRRISFGRIKLTTDTKIIELWPCGYDAPCKVRNCKLKATTIARSVNAGGRPCGNI